MSREGIQEGREQSIRVVRWTTASFLSSADCILDYSAPPDSSRIKRKSFNFCFCSDEMSEQRKK